MNQQNQTFKFKSFNFYIFSISIILFYILILSSILYLLFGNFLKLENINFSNILFSEFVVPLLIILVICIITIIRELFVILFSFGYEILDIEFNFKDKNLMLGTKYLNFRDIKPKGFWSGIFFGFKYYFKYEDKNYVFCSFSKKINSKFKKMFKIKVDDLSKDNIESNIHKKLDKFENEVFDLDNTELIKDLNKIKK